jgi:hypothetical protein
MSKAKKEYCQWKGDNKVEMIAFLVSANQTYLINRNRLFIRFADSYCQVPKFYYVVKIHGNIQRDFLDKI